MEFEALFKQYKLPELNGRYITLNHVEPLFKNFHEEFEIAVVGKSVQANPIYRIIAGHGETRIFIWSQMHGNESTTTKAIFDFLNLLNSNNEYAGQLKNSFTFCILPVVNPDGAAAYTRENANNVDLNRDSLNLSQPESKVLRQEFENFKPHFCYNMHDQRSIFGLEGGKPATVSFLAPSFNENRDINDNRLRAINLIASMSETLRQYIPGQVGRFDDSFNINCIGDMFQSLGVPTVLFEAGHYKDDYFRENTRKFIFIALLSGFKALYENVIVLNKTDEYFAIPENRINFYDIIYKNVNINYENKEKITNFASHYKEVLFENSVIFEAYIKEVGELTGYYGHIEYDCKGMRFSSADGGNLPIVEQKADFCIGFDSKFVNGVLKK